MMQRPVEKTQHGQARADMDIGQRRQNMTLLHEQQQAIQQQYELGFQKQTLELCRARAQQQATTGMPSDDYFPKLVNSHSVHQETPLTPGVPFTLQPEQVRPTPSPFNSQHLPQKHCPQFPNPFGRSGEFVQTMEHFSQHPARTSGKHLSAALAQSRSNEHRVTNLAMLETAHSSVLCHDPVPKLETPGQEGKTPNGTPALTWSTGTFCSPLRFMGNSGTTQSTPLASTPRRERNLGNFPMKLHQLLTKATMDGFDDIVSWSAYGESFIILDRDRFMSEIVPDFFNHKNMASFRRQLNMYGFQRVHLGGFKGSYYHALFHRDRPELVEQMVRVIDLPEKERNSKKQATPS